MTTNTFLRKGADRLPFGEPLTLFRDGRRYVQNYYSQSLPTYLRSRRALQTAMRAEHDSLEGILDTVLEVEPGYGVYQLSALQLRDELRELATVVDDQRPDVIMEIGTAQGGTLYTWCRYIDSTSKCISVDIPGRVFANRFYDRRQNFFRAFAGEKDISFVWQSSHLEETYQTVRTDVLNADEEVDFLFIDGDHTYEGVKQDFEKYRNMVADGGMIALHDIVHHPDDPTEVAQRRLETDAQDRHLHWTEGHPDCRVNEFWDELAEDHEVTEIVSHPDQTWGGIGIVHL